MKRSCWGCKFHYTSVERVKDGIYIISHCSKFDHQCHEEPEELEPGCFEVSAPLPGGHYR